MKRLSIRPTALALALAAAAAMFSAIPAQAAGRSCGWDPTGSYVVLDGQYVNINGVIHQCHDGRLVKW